VRKPSIHIPVPKLPRRNGVILLVLVISSSFFLILINYFTIKTLSAVRAYTSGESRYSKGQKDAARYLIMYINTGDSLYWQSFEEELRVPIGDSISRAALSHGSSDDELIKQGFLEGRNHTDDLDDMIWLFRNFHTISFMRNAIRIWKNADVTIGEEYNLAHYIRQHIRDGTLTEELKTINIKKINEITTTLTKRERAFSDTLGAASRKINTYLFLFNIVMTVLVIGGSSMYSNVMIKRLRNNNQELLHTNQELDKFVYSASHDLRSPITSVKGLIEVARYEKNIEQIKHYLTLMNKSLDKQDQFIRDIIDFSKNKRDHILLEEINLNSLIDKAVAFNQHHNHDGKPVAVKKEIRVNNIIGDVLRYRIILNNLISNAIRYRDPEKESYLSVKTYSSRDSLMIEVSDNGIGIKDDDLNRIFEMFYVIGNNRGSGLGLYVTRQTVLKLRGTIKAESKIGIGSTFKVSIPLYYATIM